jgi:serine/threonine protein kinase
MDASFCDLKGRPWTIATIAWHVPSATRILSPVGADDACYDGRGEGGEHSVREHFDRVGLDTADEPITDRDAKTGFLRAHAVPVDPGLAPTERAVPASESGFPRSGAVLEGKYRLAYRIATGQMSSVWCAEHVALATPVAIKFLQPGPGSDADGRRRFLREARIASALRSPHVVQVLDYGVERDTPYIAMEFLRGESLACRLRRRGRLAPLEVADILAPLAHALRRGHELGVVHRDLKPENIFIVPDGERELTKLLDFGVAKVRARGFGISVSCDTADGQVVGTPHYMSPEQARGAPGVDLRTDVWALGVIACECLLGYPPFVASGLASVLTAICVRPLPVPSALGVVPVGFDAWFARACARVAGARFSSLDEAVGELRRVCADTRLVGPNRIRSLRQALRALVYSRAKRPGASGAPVRSPRGSSSVPAAASRQRSPSPSTGGAAHLLGHPPNQPAARRRGPLRWLAALALISLLLGVAAGAARRGTELPRSSPRARSLSARGLPAASPPHAKCCDPSARRTSKE